MTEPATQERRYGQYCGLARSLDLVGDRWTLLVVRELLLGARRYGELLDGLPGIATNLLARRLRMLEASGLVERRVTSRPNGVAYALTPFGEGLRETVEALVRWSTPLMVPGPGTDHVRAEWLVIALRGLLAGRTSATAVTVGLTVTGADGGGPDELTLSIGPQGVTVEPGATAGTDAAVEASAPTILGLAAGVLGVDQALDRASTVRGRTTAIATAFGSA